LNADLCERGPEIKSDGALRFAATLAWLYREGRSQSLPTLIRLTFGLLMTYRVLGHFRRDKLPGLWAL
jgi:hypothetical protein